MSIVISSRPLPPPLNSHVTEIPQNLADQKARKAALYSMASKVCLVAFLAIAAGILSISIGLLAPLPPTLTLLLVLITFPLQVGFQTFMTKSFESSHAAKIATDRANELTRIQNWIRPQIEGFFKEHHLSLEKLPIDLLRQINPKEPLRALLPAIASYNYFCNQVITHLKEHDDNLYNKIEDPTLHYEGRRIGWKKLEFEAIPAALQAAFILQIISQPTLQVKLGDLGTCRAKEFDQRRFDQLLDGMDEYFVFKDGMRPALTFTSLQEMVAKQDYDGLRAKLF